MNRFLVAALSAALFVAAGCNKNKTDDPKMMSGDVCSHCEGKQMMTSDGKCEKCMMPVSDAKMMTMDVCNHCEGHQKMTADGKCEKCNMAVARPSTRPSF